MARLDRRKGEFTTTLPALKKGTQLDILVEAMGRVNFDKSIHDRKGITEKVELVNGKNAETLKGWTVYNLPVDYEFVSSRNFQDMNSSAACGIEKNDESVPAYYRATFTLDKVADTFLNMESWGKGMVWVNGHAMGRFWEIGPQQTLYVPGCWLKKGENEIVVFDIVGPKEAKSEGLSEPLLDQLLVQKPLTHRNEGENLNLSGEKPVFTGSFKPGNGWQEVKFNKPVTGRYVCIEALNSQDGKDLACIAEMYFLDKDGSRLSREPWIVKYADSEDVAHVNRSADKTFDLQESTYWSTEKGSPYPHTIVIDLGASHALTGFQCLPRMESEVPGGIKDFKIYVKGENFKY